MTQNGSEDQLTLFAADILASPLALPGSDEAIKMTDTSGQKCLGLSKLCGPAGSLERMLLATSLWASTRCYLTWKAQATPAGATLYRLSPQMPDTAVIDAGLWPTATTQDNPQMRGQGKTIGTNRGTTLGGAVRMWPTPDASNRGPRSADLVVNQSTVQRRDSGHKRGIDLQTAAKLWPTPTANEDAAGTPAGKMQRQLGNHPDIRGKTPEEWERGSLNPQWVEWLMGYPVGYTDLDN